MESMNQEDENASPKSRTAAFFLCLFLGIFGAHYFYVGRKKMGVLYLLTLGIFGWGWMVDIIRIVAKKFPDKDGRFLAGNWEF